MPEKKYQPTVTDRFYPGRISAERKQKIAGFEIPVSEFTPDDLIYGASRNITSAIYLIVDAVRKRWGDQAAIEVADEYVYRRASTGYRKFLQVRGLTSGTPALMAEYQDTVHCLQGPVACTAFTSYDDDKCVVRRTSCLYHDNRPEGMESLCKHMGDSFVKGYMAADPAIKRSEKIACLAFGADHCERIFWYK